MSTPEDRIKKKFQSALDNIGAYHIKQAAGKYTKKGIPDILIGYKSYFIGAELKRLKGGTPTPVQYKNCKEIANNDCLAFITSDVKLPYYFQEPEYFNDPLKYTPNSKKIWFDEKQPTPEDGKKWWNWTDEPHTLFIMR